MTFPPGRAAAALACLALASLAGCLQAPAETTSSAPAATPPVLPAVAGFSPWPADLAPTFAPPMLLDTVRAGGEPVIAVLTSGTILVSAHPGFTHYHPSGDGSHVPTELLQDFGGQSYLWRSADNGTTWTPIGLPIQAAGGAGPRGAGLGVSDPEFTVMQDGTVCTTDLEALAAASVACSSDDGLTWLPGNPLASGQPVDRQWLASYKDELYFTSNPQGPSTADFRVSKDKGVTWTDLGTTPCNSDVVADRRNGHLIQGCNGTGITVSTDGGKTWSDVRQPEGASSGGSRMMTEPALDAAGNVWTAWTDGEQTLWYAGTPDEGVTWPWVVDLTAHVRLFAATNPCAAAPATVTCTPGPTSPAAHGGGSDTNGTYVWPWISAGSAGRLAVSWIGSYKEAPSESQGGPWFIFTAFVMDATSGAPSITVVQVTPEPIHTNPICQQGTLCEATSVTGSPDGDRRLGDFFETTVDPATGCLRGAWSNTAQQGQDVISHPQFAKQVGPCTMLEATDIGVFTPTQG